MNPFRGLAYIVIDDCDVTNAPCPSLTGIIHMQCLSPRSVQRLAGVHADLVKVVSRAMELTEIDFIVTEGLRTKARQRQLVAAGASQTMNSRHLTGHAIDLAATVNGKVRWDWPLYYKLADAMKAAAKELGVEMEWGGDWQSFKDGPHFQLSRDAYP